MCHPTRPRLGAPVVVVWVSAKGSPEAQTLTGLRSPKHSSSNTSLTLNGKDPIYLSTNRV